MTNITPTLDPALPRRFADFDTLVDAVDYAAKGQRGCNFYNAKGDLVETITYTELRERAHAIGRRLIAKGFKKGERIALVAETSSDFVTFFIGCQYASILPVPLPLPTSFGGKEGYIGQLKLQLESCQANGVMAPTFMNDMIDQAKMGKHLRFAGDFKAYMSLNDNADLRLPGQDDLAYLQYSSGSTRFPHGVAVTHRSLMSNTHGMSYHGVKLQETDRCVSWLPFYHDMGLVGTLLACVTCQISVDFIPTEEFARRPLSWLRVISKNKGTITYSPTFGFDICARRASLRSGALEELDLSSLRVAGVGAEMIRPDVLRFFVELFGKVGFNEKAFLPSYGMAECTLGVSFGEPGTGFKIDLVEEDLLSGGRMHVAQKAGRKREVVNCGKPLPEFELEIRDEDDNVLSNGVVGRVYLRGTSVMREYYNDPETTREVLSSDGWLDTGDMGYIKEGSIYIVGRAKDMIIVNGRNHWPQDIEWAAEQMDLVKVGDIAAISVPGETGEEIPMILAQCRLSDVAERTKFTEDLKKHVHKETGINCLIKLVAPRTLPHTSSGKLSRSKARQEYLAGRLRAVG